MSASRKLGTLYKVLNKDGSTCHGGAGVWPKPGEWLEVSGGLVPCANGLHLCRREDLVLWLGPTIWVAEHEGETVEDSDKVVVRKARLLRRVGAWTKRTARLFTCDCADRALALIEKPDPRSLEAVAVARRFADGMATRTELDAARDAAWTAGAAARDAEAAAWTAWTAAWDAEAAAWTAARAARAAERAWQTNHLFEILEGRLYA